MRIRIFRAFASNNSGSYTIVGSFTSPLAAEDVARVLAKVCAEHQAWSEGADRAESPLDRFVREHGLSEDQPGRGQEWPEYGPPPRVLVLGHQVLLHAPYTVTLPRLFGEFFYKRGGRVDVEHDHAHEQLAVEISFLVPDLGWSAADSAERKRRIDEVLIALAVTLPDLCAPPQEGGAPAILPVFHWSERHVTAIFADLVEGVESVRRTAAQHGVQIHVRIHECAHAGEDPLAHLRAGKTRVILWAIGADRVAALRALRDVLGSELSHAQAMLEQLPREVLVDVEPASADRAVETLRNAGCDAECVLAHDPG